MTIHVTVVTCNNYKAMNQPFFIKSVPKNERWAIFCDISYPIKNGFIISVDSPEKKYDSYFK